VDRKASLKEVFLKATEIYEPEYLENRQFFYPCEVVVSIIRGFDIYRWLSVSDSVSKEALDYFKKINYYNGFKIDEFEKQKNEEPFIVFEPEKESIAIINKVVNSIWQRLFERRTSALQSWWNTILDELILNIFEHSEAMKAIIYAQRKSDLNILEL